MGSGRTSSDTTYSRRVRILLPLPLAGAFDYLADPAQRLAPGDLVRVPLGPRVVTGAVWDGDTDGAGAAASPVRLRTDFTRAKSSRDENGLAT